MNYEIGDNVYVEYWGTVTYAQIVGYDYPLYIIELPNGKQAKIYADEIQSKV